MDEWSSPSVIALHGAVTELTLRIARLEERANLPPVALRTFAQPGSNIPAPYAPCSCEEAEDLRSQVRALTAKTWTLDTRAATAEARVRELETVMRLTLPIGATP